MKHGNKGAGKAARAQESAGSQGPVLAIPYPPEVAPVVAEEAASVPHFTVREQQVGGWLAEGKSDPEIAGILGIDVETVRTHIKSMRVKTGVYSRNVFFAWIWRNRCAFHAFRPPTRRRVKYT
ncbi:MAG: helix-turn-helix transcriptional regulator [Verrucomicrobiota bacterium]|nr:helix-turn-helix transcriptional regulator [Verrucomicrobiota bacterium]